MLFPSTLRRSLVGLVAAVAVTVSLGGPAGAVPSTGSIASLDMVLDANNGPDAVFEVPDTTSSPCPADTSAPELDIEFNGGSGATEVTGVRIPDDFFQNTFLLGSYWYRTELSLWISAAGPRTGTITGSAPTYAMDQSLPLRYDLYRIGAVGGPYDCTGGQQVCQTFMKLTLEGTWTPASPNTSAAAPGTAQLSGSGPTANGACSAPFAGWYNQRTVTVNDLTVAFT